MQDGGFVKENMSFDDLDPLLGVIGTSSLLYELSHTLFLCLLEM
jgi:hypothetical protein